LCKVNYYEELGVARSASVDEIRRAYRNVARLLHPDRQADETLRRLAGFQMTRLNAVLQTLTDPASRREYDQGLRQQSSGGGTWIHGVSSGPPVSSVRSRVRWSSLTWLCAMLVALGALVVFLVRDTGTQQAGGEDNISSGVPQGGAAGARSNWSTGRAAARERLPGREGGGFGGEWFYAQPAKRADSQDLYPPEYIDVEISDTRGNVKGMYSAKYSVAGRPISPFVFFEFGGSARPPSANLKWSGSGGVAGHVRLTLLSARSLQVDWSTDRPGEEQGLISGTATLLRREPQ
jgi:curved DNA-binding protein CbpA